MLATYRLSTCFMERCIQSRRCGPEQASNGKVDGYHFQPSTENRRFPLQVSDANQFEAISKPAV